MTVRTATAPDGTVVDLVGVGTSTVLDTDRVRVWDVTLPPGGLHPWHQHENPYVVLSIAGSTGRMDWLDGREPRHISEYTGGAVFRPVSPVHRLTNTGTQHYRNRLVELKDLGENRAEGVLDVGEGERSIPGEPPTAVDSPDDALRPVLANPYVRVWTVTVPPGGRTIQLDEAQYVLAAIDADLEGEALDASVRAAVGGETTLPNDTSNDLDWFVLALDYLDGDDI